MPPPAENRLPGLDLLRAVAIVVTMLFHKGIDPEAFPVIGQVARFGWMGVDLFFVLSGFLIAGQLFRSYSAGRPFSFPDFYTRRAFRILPAYLAVLALYFLLPSFREAPRIRPLWEFLTFTENFRIDYFNTRAFSHVWSLCVEEHFYLLMPLLVFGLMKKPSTRKATFVALGLLLGGMALRAWIWVHTLAPLQPEDPGAFALRYVETIYYPTTTRLDGLLAGACLAAVQAFRPQWWAWAMGRGIRLLLAGFLVTGCALLTFLDRFSLVGAVVGFPLLSLGLSLVVAASVSQTCALSRWKVPGATGLATLAFTLYLTHKAVFHLNETHFEKLLDRGSHWAFAIHAGTALVAALLLHCAIEKPFLRLRERLTFRRD